MNDPTTTVTIITTIGVVISALIALVGGVVTARASGRASRATAELEGRKIDLERVKSMSDDIDQLRKQRKEDQAEHRAEIAQLREEHAGELGRLRERLDQLEQQRVEDKARFETLIEYARLLLRQMRAAQLQPPDPPPGLDLAAP